MILSETTVFESRPAGVKPEKILKTAAYYLSFVAFGSIIGVIGPTLPELAAQTGTKLSMISYLFTGHSLGIPKKMKLHGFAVDRIRQSEKLYFVIGFAVAK